MKSHRYCSTECEGVWCGKTITLPPQTGAFGPANRGKYRLRSTGEIIKDPNVLATWSITPPVKVVTAERTDRSLL
jgi:hypothetical protein